MAAFSCVKESETLQQPQDDERFAEFDPVVNFSLETYMDGSSTETKTTYAGDETMVYDPVRFERINWNVGTNPDMVRIYSEDLFTKNKKAYADYYATEIGGQTNWSINREDVADATPTTNENDSFYWELSRDKTGKDTSYFYAIYPSPAATGATLSVVGALDKAKHTLTVEGVIPREQDYTLDESTSGVIEYLPDMTNAYMFAAAKVPSAEAGYRKVPLRFKPLFSAIKLMISARSAVGTANVGTKDPAVEKYRLSKVVLRTDINYDDVYLRPYDGADYNGAGATRMALGGKFTAGFRAGSAEYQEGSKYQFQTGNYFYPGKPDDPDYISVPQISVTDTTRTLVIDIDPADRRVFGDNTVKLTFLALPDTLQYMTVDYTLEYLENSFLPTSDPKYLDPEDPASWTDPIAEVRTVRRTLALQDRNYIYQKDNPGTVDYKTFKDFEGTWYKHNPAHKLYLRSGIPYIETYFKVEAQSLFPRTWEAGSDKVDTESTLASDHYLAKNFYSVVSYRDSSGVLQPLKWRVTGYSSTNLDPNSPSWGGTTRPTWLMLRGDDGSYNPSMDFRGDDPLSGVDPSGDPWERAWGAGTHMDGKVDASVSLYGFSAFKEGHTYVFYNAGAQNNGPRSKSWDNSRTLEWDDPLYFNYCDQDGEFYYPDKDENGNVHPRAGESYAYDLGHHDIYGNLWTGITKNGEKGKGPYNTANCYVVSRPGWYRLPVVYGNAIKNGMTNSAAYTGSEGTYRLGSLKDHLNEDISAPVIPYPIDEKAEIVWEDAYDFVQSNFVVGRTEQQKPFYWKDPGTGYGYIYFYVNQVAEGNAVLAAKSEDKIVWSWHIWGVNDPGTKLNPVEIQPNEYFHNSLGADKVFTYKSVYGSTWVWKELDLGQGTKETEVAPKCCYVRFTQYWKGKEIAHRVVCFAQAGVKDESGLDQAPTYQWGRKDPFKYEATFSNIEFVTASDATDFGKAIRNPARFYNAGVRQSWHGNARFDNLWNTGLDYYPTTFDSYYVDVPAGGGRRDSRVTKTVYDPSPAGFVIPNLFAFTAFNAKGLLQVKVDNLGAVAKHTAWSTSESGADGFTRYLNFLAEYRYSGAYRRKDDGRQVRFYARGRRRGDNNEDAGKQDKTNEGFYWLAEPACHGGDVSWNYGSSFHFTNGSPAPIYPVAGAKDNSSGNQAKWQRTHGLYVRPMGEPTTP